MKIKFLPALFAALGMTAFLASCSSEECMKCTYTSGNTSYSGTFCEEDFDTKAEYEAYVSYVKTQDGVSCETKKLK